MNAVSQSGSIPASSSEVKICEGGSITLYKFTRKPLPPEQPNPFREESVMDRIKREYRAKPLGEYDITRISWRHGSVFVRLVRRGDVVDLALSELIDYHVYLPLETC